jgi:hypothetical protein
MKTFLRYFTAGIIPIACFSLSVLSYKRGLTLIKGLTQTNEESNLSFVLGLVVVALSWGIAAYSIKMGWDIIKPLRESFKKNKDESQNNKG